MAVTIKERPTSRRFTEGTSAELTYLIRGTDNESLALSMLNSTSPTLYMSIKRKHSELEPVHIDTVNPEACIWLGTAHYQNDSRSSDVSHPTEHSFDTMGGTGHITQAEEHISDHAASGTPPDHKGAIGVTANGVEGVDITVPAFNWRVAYYFDISSLTNSYRGTLYALTGKVNNAAFKGNNAGECLFLGASASWNEEDDGAMVTFNFASSPNRTSLTVGSITGIAKKGWEYLWIEYAQDSDDLAKQMISKPKAAHVEQVYEYGDFSLLGIGT